MTTFINACRHFKSIDDLRYEAIDHYLNLRTNKNTPF